MRVNSVDRGYLSPNISWNSWEHSQSIKKINIDTDYPTKLVKIKYII